MTLPLDGTGYDFECPTRFDQPLLWLVVPLSTWMKTADPEDISTGAAAACL